MKQESRRARGGEYRSVPIHGFLMGSGAEFRRELKEAGSKSNLKSLVGNEISTNISRPGKSGQGKSAPGKERRYCILYLCVCACACPMDQSFKCIQSIESVCMFVNVYLNLACSFCLVAACLHGKF